MKSEKLSTEIAALQRKQKETKNAVAKKALSSKIERLKKELDEITTSAQAKTALAKAQSKIREMSQKDFGEFVKKLAAKPEFSFLKGMSKSKIKDDIMRVAKPVGWRFRGRTNVKKPTKKDIQEGNNVYYEGRVNRSDVSRTVRLADGGGVGDEISLAIKYGKMLNDLNKEKQFNKKIELNSALKNFEKQNEISIDSNNVISVKGNKVAYIDKINAKTGQPKTNWDIKKYAKGGGVGRYYGGEYITDNDLMKLKNFEIVEKDRIRITPQSNEYGTRFGYDIEYLDENGKWEGSHSVSAYSKGEAFEKLKNKFQGKEYAKGGKTDFGMLSVKAGIDNNPNPTYADKIAGAKMNKMAKGGGVYSIGDKVMVKDDGYVKSFEGFDLSQPATITSKNKVKTSAGIKYSYGIEFADGRKPFNNASERSLLPIENKMAEGGNIVVGKKYLNNYRLQNGDSGYQIIEVVDTNYFSVAYGGGKVVRCKIVESSESNTVGEYVEYSKDSIRKYVKYGILKPIDKYATGGGVGLVNYGDYSPTVSYKIPDEELSNFIDYVYDVYKEQGYTKMQVKNAVNRYLSDLDKQYTWGYGDSLDRERVYEYLLNPKLKGIQNPSLAKGGDVQSSEPHRLHMMAKGGMTFSESVLKEGLSDMLHHLYKAQNELDGIMGYLDRTGQGGMKSALKSKFGLNSISETTEKIDTYLDK